MNKRSDVMDSIEEFKKNIPFVLIMLPVRTRNKLRVKLETGFDPRRIPNRLCQWKAQIRFFKGISRKGYYS